MDLSYLEELEKKYNFQYPELYKQLCRDGMLGINHPNFCWDEDAFVKLQENPTLFYYSRYDLIDQEELEESIEWLNNPENYKIEQNSKLIPFMGNDFDYFVCFYIKEDSSASIIFVDMDSSLLLQASNFKDYIFRVLLESCSFYSSLNEIEEHIENMKAMFKSHKVYMKEEHCRAIESILSRDKQTMIFEDKAIYCIVSEEDVAEILKAGSFPNITNE